MLEADLFYFALSCSLTMSALVRNRKACRAADYQKCVCVCAEIKLCVTVHSATSRQTGSAAYFFAFCSLQVNMAETHSLTAAQGRKVSDQAERGHRDEAG